MYKTHQTETKKKELGGTLLLWPQRTGPSVLRGFLLHALDMQMVWPHLNLPWCWFWRRPHSQQEFPLSFTKLLTGPVGSTMRGLLRSLESFSDSQHKINWHGHRQGIWNEVGNQPFLPQMANLHYHLLTSHTLTNPSSFKTLPVSHTTFLYTVWWIRWVLSLELLDFPFLVPLNYRDTFAYR